MKLEWLDMYDDSAYADVPDDAREAPLTLAVTLDTQDEGKFRASLLENNPDTFRREEIFSVGFAANGMDDAKTKAPFILHRALYRISTDARTAAEAKARTGIAQDELDECNRTILFHAHLANVLKPCMPARPGLLDGNLRSTMTIGDVYEQACRNRDKLLSLFAVDGEQDMSEQIRVVLRYHDNERKLFRHTDTQAMLARVDAVVMAAIYALPAGNTRSRARHAERTDARNPRDGIVAYQTPTWERRGYTRRTKSGTVVYVRPTTCKRHCMEEVANAK